MKETEKTLNVKCPLDCEFKIGTTWSGDTLIWDSTELKNL